MLERRAGLIVCFVGALACTDDRGSGDEEVGETDATNDADTTSDTSTDDDTTEGESCEPGPDSAQVETMAGPILGPIDDGIARFLNIPYAAPPIGDLRWAAPQPPPAWIEPRDASEFGERCIQLAVSGDDPTTAGSEDCLQLNVWTPRPCPDGDRPVLVFIHGGGNAVGSAVDPLYDGAELARREDVVVVTFNYRLGVLGWLAHPDLDTEAGNSGNYGLADQLAALEWVRDNIDHFGGDPQRVMLFGESAGAVNTCTVIGSPQSAGLITGAVVQSGTCNQPTRARLDLLVDEFVGNSGCEGPDVLACLRARDAAELMLVTPNGYPGVSSLSPGWGPHVDGMLLPATTLEALEAGEVGIPVVIGNNADETAKDAPPDLSEAEYEALIQAYFGVLAPQVLAAYPIVEYGNDPSVAWANLTADVKFVCNARRSAVASASGGQPTWRYVFSYTGYDAIGGMPKYAFHGLELIYQFGNWNAVEFGGIEYVPNDDDLALRDTMMMVWSDFAATGEFVGSAYDPATDPWHGFGGIGGSGYRTQQCDFWDQYL